MNKNWFIYKDNELKELKGEESKKYITRRYKKACEVINEINDMVNDLQQLISEYKENKDEEDAYYSLSQSGELPSIIEIVSEEIIEKIERSGIHND